ncbi:MAG: TIGR04149 family rSAM-modified RiPP [Niabella sp.]
MKNKKINFENIEIIKDVEVIDENQLEKLKGGVDNAGNCTCSFINSNKVTDPETPKG